MSSDLTNASLLLLDTNGSNATSISIPEQTTGTNISGHQILSQVQQELNFLPSTNDNVLVMGNIQMPNGDQVQNVHTAAIMTGTMESNVNKDSDLLISSKSFDLSSTTISLDSPDGGTQSSKNPKYSIWQSEFYAQYFDITTEIFCRRVLWSLLPLTGGNKGTYMERYIQSSPDLYGPFWISITLSFTIAICADVIKYFKSFQLAAVTNNSTIEPTVTARSLAFNFDYVHLAIVITFSYITIAPLILWSFCQWRKCARLYTFFECLCSYGYSIAVFIPVTILSLVNIRQLQLILFASAAFLSGSVLLISFAPVVHSDPSRSFKFAYLILLFILGAHFILALLYLYLFL